MIKKGIRFLNELKALSKTLTYIRESLGRIESRQIMSFDVGIAGAEFKVYSQSGEDGIIQYLVNKLEVKDKRFIEFGVENYMESNTRFLTLNNYWSGLIIDGNEENITYIKNDPIYWRTNIKAVHSFITKDNINDLFKNNGITGEIGLLSIDIDGNDYWVWKEIEVVNPAIIVAEYNSLFGSERKVTVPYKADFVRTNEHFSHTYYGASIGALTHLANERGYKLVTTNRSGNNVFYVREDLMDGLKELSAQEAFRPINFRESHNEAGQLVFPNFDLARKIIGEMKVYDIELNKEVTVNSLW